MWEFKFSWKFFRSPPGSERGFQSLDLWHLIILGALMRLFVWYYFLGFQQDASYAFQPKMESGSPCTHRRAFSVNLCPLLADWRRPAGSRRLACQFLTCGCLLWQLKRSRRIAGKLICRCCDTWGASSRIACARHPPCKTGSSLSTCGRWSSLCRLASCKPTSVQMSRSISVLLWGFWPAWPSLPPLCCTTQGFFPSSSGRIIASGKCRPNCLSARSIPSQWHWRPA